MTLEEFEKLCKAHDLTYDFSDDHSVWLRGEKSLSKIREAASKLKREDVVRVWNSVVDTKIIESHRKQFYWS